ncbi:hypothetical protein K32_03890 [Kaistia sp. 32K]|nr:hypothetical protein K32_03890 [Kaistia sp. 32K]
MALAGLLAACTTTQPARVATSGLDQARQACQTAYDSGRITTREARAKCLNNAENQFPADFPDKKLLQQQQSLRLSLAKQVDSGRLTQAQAEAQYVSSLKRISAKAGT